MDDHVTKHIIRFRSNPDLPYSIAHGVYGGVNDMGEIECNFFVESDDLPDHIERLVRNEDGALLSEDVVTDGTGIHYATRTIVSRVVLGYPAAQAIKNWLDEQLKALEEMPNGEMPDIFDGTSSGPRQ